MVVLRTLGAPQRRLLGGRRARSVTGAQAEPVPTCRASIVRAEPFGSQAEADAWLEDDRDELVRAAERDLNLVVRSHRAAAADPYARDVSADHALVVRVGYGHGEQVADGRYERALELPRRPARRRRGEALAPQERFAAILGGREPLLAGEELLLRARLDLDTGRTREAALQARVALEALLAELEDADLGGLRDGVGRAANAALEGELDPDGAAALGEAVEQMERAVRRHAARGPAGGG